MTATLPKGLAVVIAGLVANLVLTVSMDVSLSAAGVLPPFGTGYTQVALLSVALGYRTVFAAAGGFVTAQLAPDAPRLHVAWLMGIGLVIGLLSVAGGRTMFPIWYLLGIVALSVPATWLGGALAPHCRLPTRLRCGSGIVMMPVSSRNSLAAGRYSFVERTQLRGAHCRCSCTLGVEGAVNAGRRRSSDVAVQRHQESHPVRG